VLAAPAQAGTRGQLHLQHRRRIGEHAVAEGAHLGREPLGQALQALAQHLVVVPAPGVHRYHRLLRALQRSPFLLHPAGIARAGR
jgi:hypothetical protein